MRYTGKLLIHLDKRKRITEAFLLLTKVVKGKIGMIWQKINRNRFICTSWDVDQL